MEFNGATSSYSTFSEAWSTAIGFDTTSSLRATVTLLSNLDYDASIVNVADYVTLDLSGYTLTFTVDGADLTSSGGDLIIQSTGNTGSIASTASTCQTLVDITGGSGSLTNVNLRGVYIKTGLTVKNEGTVVDASKVNIWGRGLTDSILVDNKAVLNIHSASVSSGNYTALKRTNQGVVNLVPNSSEKVNFAVDSNDYFTTYTALIYSDGTSGTAFYLNGEGQVNVTGSNDETFSYMIQSGADDAFILNKGTLIVSAGSSIMTSPFSNAPGLTIGTNCTVTAGNSEGEATLVASPDENTYKNNSNKYLSLVAKKDVYTITYYDQGSSDKLDYSGYTNQIETSYTYGTGHSLPTVSRYQYLLDGWYTSYNGTEAASDISATDTGNRTFYAKWIFPEAKVTFDVNGDGDTYDDGEEVSYPTLDLAWAAAIGHASTSTNKITITLLEDVNNSSHLVNDEDYIVFNIDKYTLNFSTENGYLTSNGGSLEIKGTGKIASQVTSHADGGTVAFLGGIGVITGVSLDNYSTSGDYNPALYVNNAVVTATGGTYSTSGYKTIGVYNSGVFNFYEGDIYSGSKYAIYLGTNGKVICCRL